MSAPDSLENDEQVIVDRILWSLEANIVRDEIDDLGERIRVLDGTPIWNPAVFANEKLLPAPDESIVDDLLIAHEAFQMEAAYADELRKAANAFEDDLATQDLIVEYLRIHEKQAWFLREFIRKVNIDDYDEEVFETNGSTS